MKLRILSVVLLLASAWCAWGGQTVKVDGANFAVGGKVSYAEPIEIRGLSFYSAKAVGTNEDCVLITGSVVNNLPVYTVKVHITIGLWTMRGTEEAPSVTATTCVNCPLPGKPTRFVAFGKVPASWVKGHSVTYSLERVRLEDRPVPQNSSAVPGRR